MQAASRSLHLAHNGRHEHSALLPGCFPASIPANPQLARRLQHRYVAAALPVASVAEVSSSLTVLHQPHWVSKPSRRALLVAAAFEEHARNAGEDLRHVSLQGNLSTC
jgi:hypothetical protein